MRRMNHHGSHGCAWCNEVFNYALDRDRHEERVHEREMSAPAPRDVESKIAAAHPEAPLADDSHPDEKRARAGVLAEIAAHAERGRAVLVHGYTFRRWSEVLAAADLNDALKAYAVYNRLHDALSVITKDPIIRAWLAANDPKALEQADAALGKCECDLKATDGYHVRGCPRLGVEA